MFIRPRGFCVTLITVSRRTDKPSRFKYRKTQTSPNVLNALCPSYQTSSDQRFSIVQYVNGLPVANVPRNVLEANGSIPKMLVVNGRARLSCIVPKRERGGAPRTGNRIQFFAGSRTPENSAANHRPVGDSGREFSVKASRSAAYVFRFLFLVVTPETKARPFDQWPSL